MAWPVLPTTLLYTDQVKTRSASWTQDSAGGRVATMSAWSLSWIACSITASNATDVEKNSKEQMFGQWVVTAPQRLGYNRDELLWQATGSILTITGVQSITDGTGRTWDHNCEEHPIH